MTPLPIPYPRAARPAAAPALPPWWSHLPRAVVMFPVCAVAFVVFLAGGLLWTLVGEEEE